MLVALLVTFASSIAAAVAMWRLSLRLQDAGIVDIMWGYGFAVLCVVSALFADRLDARGLLLLGCVLLWSLRLGTHLWLRCLGRGEDFRYREMRRYHGADFGKRSLVRVFLFQASIQWLLSLPLQIAPHTPSSQALGWIDLIGLLIFGCGFVIESVADFQLERFRRAHAGEARVMDRGLWRFSRHPNYFGECVVAWGLFVIVSQSAYGPWFVWSPLALTFLLTKVSGVPYLERGLRERLPGYLDYMRRTPAFMPRWPRSASAQSCLGCD